MKEEIEKQSMQPKGVVTIETFDSDGNPVQRVKANNFIAKGMDYRYYLEMLQAFRGESAAAYPFRKMMLTTANHLEDPAGEWYMKGDVIGWAKSGTPYALTDDVRGTINEAESINTGDRLRFVFDFATNQANGQIDSVYFSTDPEDQSPPAIGNYGNLLPSGFASGIPDRTSAAGIPLVQIIDPDNPTWRVAKVIRHNNQYYALMATHQPLDFSQENRWLVVFDGNMAVQYRQELTVGDGFTDFEIVGSKLYGAIALMSPHTQTYDITTTPWVDEGHTIMSGGLGSVIRGLSYDLQNDAMDMIFYESVNTLRLEKRLLSDWSLLSTSTKNMYPITYENSAPNSLSEVISQSCKLFRTAGGDLLTSLFCINDDGIIDIGGHGWPGSAQKGLTGVFDDVIVDMYGYIVPAHGFSSRFKLPTPVIKTSTNTMKVTYDFILPNMLL